MDTKKFIREAYRQIVEEGISNVKLNNERIEIYEDDAAIFRVEKDGGLFYSSDKRLSSVIDELHEKIEPIVKDVKEYVGLLDSATEIKACDFNMPYKQLAEFNNIIFAVTEHSNGSFEFATWERKSNDSLYNGHYNTDYRSAKKDFATRSKLLNENLVFNNHELVEIYRCLEDTLNNDYEMTDEQRNMLESIHDRIQYSVANFNNLLKEAIAQSPGENFEQSM